MDRHEWILKRNCSLTPAQLVRAYGVLCALSFAVAAVFTLRGAWVVLAFATVEMAAVALAFLHYARHATDHEHIVLVDGYLVVKRVEAGRVHQVRLDRCWTRIAPPSGTQDLIRLENRGMTVQVGRFVTGAKRRQVAQELRRELHGVPASFSAA